jgi:hypothetical protein
MFRRLFGHNQVSVSAKALNLYPIWIHIMSCLYTPVFRAQVDWTLTLPSATSCDSAAPLAEKTAAARPELLVHIV